MSPRAGEGNAEAILSAIESNPAAGDQAIADIVGVSRQRVGQVRAQQHGAKAPGRPRVADEPMEKTSVRLPAAELDRARKRGEDMSNRVRAGLELLRAREDSPAVAEVAEYLRRALLEAAELVERLARQQGQDVRRELARWHHLTGPGCPTCRAQVVASERDTQGATHRRCAEGHAWVTL